MKSPTPSKRKSVEDLPPVTSKATAVKRGTCVRGGCPNNGKHLTALGYLCSEECRAYLQNRLFLIVQGIDPDTLQPMEPRSTANETSPEKVTGGTTPPREI